MLNLDLPADFRLPLLTLDGVGVTTGVAEAAAAAAAAALLDAAGDSLTFSGGCSLLLGDEAAGTSLLSSADFWSDGAGLF